MYLQQCRIPEADKAKVVVHHLAGVARDEIKCHNDNVTGVITVLSSFVYYELSPEATVFR